MTTLIIIILAMAGLFFLIPVFLKKSFRNPVRVHERTPKQEGIDHCEEVSIPTKNNKNLYGWWLPGDPTRPVLIMVHGWGRNVAKMMPYIKNLHPKGYNILVFDSRNHGKSDPDEYSSMIKFAEDIMAAVDFVQSKKETRQKIGLIGLSIGGAASVYAAAHDPRIEAVVTVGAFARSEDVMKQNFLNKPLLKPFTPLLFKILELKLKTKLQDIAPENNIAQAQAQFLIIHGEKDDVVPVEQAKRLYAAAQPGKATLRLFKDKSHSNCHFEPGFWELPDQFFITSLSSRS